MAYPEEVKEIMKKIPKEHHKDVRKIMEIYFKIGVEEVQGLVGIISHLPSKDISEYGVFHESELDGG
jgi:hypothetical protein